MRPPALHHLNILPFQLSQYILNNGGVLMAGEEAAGAERYENIHGDRYEDIQGTESFITNQVRRESISTSRNLSLGNLAVENIFGTEIILTINVL